jgi:hypothetical protein
MEAGQTPGLRVPLRRSPDGNGFRLGFGPDGVRTEAITTAQAMTLLSELARELGLTLTGASGQPPFPQPPRPEAGPYERGDMP